MVSVVFSRVVILRYGVGEREKERKHLLPAFSSGRDFSIKSILLAIPMTISNCELVYGHSNKSYTMVLSVENNLSTSSIHKILYIYTQHHKYIGFLLRFDKRKILSNSCLAFSQESLFPETSS